MGVGLASVPFRFGWDLIEWKPQIDESRVDLGVKLDDELVEIHDEVEMEDDQTEVFRPKIELDLGTGPDPVRDFEDEMFSVIEERPGDSFEKVGDINLTEGPNTH